MGNKCKIRKIIIDEVLSKKGLPRVLKGKGYGIIEDCGGVDGLKSIAEAYSEKSGEEYENYCEWLLDDDIDLVSFDIEDMNNRLKKFQEFMKNFMKMEYILQRKK